LGGVRKWSVKGKDGRIDEYPSLGEKKRGPVLSRRKRMSRKKEKKTVQDKEPGACGGIQWQSEVWIGDKKGRGMSLKSAKGKAACIGRGKEREQIRETLKREGGGKPYPRGKGFVGQPSV